MERTDIPPSEFVAGPFELWDHQWALLASGDFASRRFNCMTVSWGSLGVIWNQPFAMVLVRPQRYTYKFIEQFDTFTLCVFPESHRGTLENLGTRSGREIDKIGASGLTPIAAVRVASPIFDEAELAIECRKMYFDDLEHRHFLADFIMPMYRGDYHRMYFGQVVHIAGNARYRRQG
jgi:flavin reductase (DIM6/NTAB) family NADH-FMN oxidoreductase RutF